MAIAGHPLDEVMAMVWRRIGLVCMVTLCIGVIFASSYLAGLSTPEEAVESQPVEYVPDFVQQLAGVDRTLRRQRPVPGAMLQPAQDSAWYEGLGVYAAHAGVDLAADVGQPVQAISAGIVTATTRSRLWGAVVVMLLDDGIEVEYRGLTWPLPVISGQRLVLGDTVGYVGTMHAETATSHVHIGMTQDGVSLDPSTYWGE